MSKMREGVCPQCESNEVYYDTTLGPNAGIQLSFWGRSAYIFYYVCTNCGYTESYILEKDRLSEIAQKWRRADGQKKKNEE